MKISHYKFIQQVFLSVMLIGLIISCTPEEKFIGNLEEYPGEKTGTIKTYREDGSLYQEGQFTDGKLEGHRRIYFPSGEIQIEETHANNTYHGSYKKYFENGQLKSEGEYKDGSMEGVWKRYYEDGAVRDEVAMKDNLENGPFKEYYENGNLKATGEYKGGEFEEGPLQLFDESGTLIKKMNCTNGVCHTVWEKESAE